MHICYFVLVFAVELARREADQGILVLAEVAGFRLPYPSPVNVLLELIFELISKLVMARLS